MGGCHFAGVIGDYNVAEMFSDLLLLDINNRVTNIDAHLLLVDANIIALHAQDTNFAAQLVIIYGHLAIHDQNIIDLQNDINDVNTALNLRIDDVNADLISEVARLDGRIDDINGRLTTLEAKVSAMNHATINVNYNATTKILTVWGEAAHGATTITMDINSSDGMFSFTGYTTTPNAENAYSYIIDTNTFAQKQYNITVTMDGIGGPHSAGALVLLGTGDYGFKQIGYNTDLGYDYDPSTRPMPIDFSIRVYETGLHTIKIVGNSDTNYNIDQILYSAYSLSAGQDTRLIGSKIVFPGDGNYTLYLTTGDLISGFDYNSVEITVQVIDESTLIPDGNITINQILNDNIHSVQANTFYTKDDFVLSAGLSGIDWGVDCSISYLYSGTQFTHLWDFGKVGPICSGTIFLNDINYGKPSNEGLYLIRAKNSFDGGEKKADLNVGFDYTAPVISNITPLAGSIINKMAYLKVNVVDNLSGTDKVWFRIYTKDANNDNNVLAWAKQADYNSISDKWETDFNTLEVPDAYYNVDINSIDVAGNTSSEFIDPLIDNTSPVIDANSFIITPSPVLRNETLTIDANVSDNLSGVDVVTATIRDINSNIVETLILSGNGNYTGTVTIDINWDTNIHTITIDANDNAGNNAIQKDQNVLVVKNYYFNIDTTKSGTAKTSFTIDGNFRDDTGAVPTADGNVILLSGSAINDMNVEFDGNGKYTVITNALGQGTYYIDLNYNTTDYNYTDQVVITVGPAPIVTPGGGGPSGGGVPRDVCGNNICSTTETFDSCPVDCEAPIEPEEPETGGEPDEGTPTGGDELVVTETPTLIEPEVEPKEPEGPTGFFGLGEATDLGVGIIGLLAILTLLGILWKRKH